MIIIEHILRLFKVCADFESVFDILIFNDKLDQLIYKNLFIAESSAVSDKLNT